MSLKFESIFINFSQLNDANPTTCPKNSPLSMDVKFELERSIGRLKIPYRHPMSSESRRAKFHRDTRPKSVQTRHARGRLLGRA